MFVTQENLFLMSDKGRYKMLEFVFPTETIQSKLIRNGFTAIPYVVDGFNGKIATLIYVARFICKEYSNAYITVTEDFETVTIFNLPFATIGEKQFVEWLCGDDEQFNKISKYIVRDDNRCNLAFVLGYLQE